MQVFRIVRSRHASMAFSGEGARLFGARWNPPGVPVVYTSLSLSLALVELFVHLDASEQPDDLVSIKAELPVPLERAERLNVATLPKDWRRVNHPALQQIGVEWARSGRSLVLIVPSAVVDGEFNALINPGHPEAKRISLAKPKPFHFDSRMFKSKA